jgi:integrase
VTGAALWSDAVGLLPHRVTAYENAEKKNLVYLRWRADGNWKKRSLGVSLRDDRGRIRADVKRMVLSEAERQYELLSGKRSPDAARSAPLTVANAWTIVSDPATGLYPVRTEHAKQIARELNTAARIWGAQMAWDDVDRSRLRMLGRTRIDEIRARGKNGGLRGAIETVRSVLTAAAWLRDEQKIAHDACLAPRAWREELRTYFRQLAGTSADPDRPRHTVAEMRRILRKAEEVDPRFGLLMALGAELRLGQVRRCRRSDISSDHRTLTVRSAGKKKGTVQELTPGQWEAWERAIGEGGYLAECEAELADYPLFPGGKLVQGTAVPAKHGVAAAIDRTAVRDWFKIVEQLAKVEHVKGRGPYGLRRVAVDAGKKQGISREGLQALGGWTTSEMPDNIYAEQNSEYARHEAAEHRAKMRGETK